MKEINRSFFEYMDRNSDIDEISEFRLQDCSTCGKILPCPTRDKPEGWKKHLPPNYINATLCINWQPDF